MTDEREVLHALAMAGVADPATVAGAADASADEVGETLESLASDGLVEETDGLWYVTDAGDERLTERCRARLDDRSLARLRERFDEFETLDGRMKDLASEWQASRDERLVSDLAALHAEVEAVFEPLGDGRRVYEPYLEDLRAALDALEDGREAYFTGTDVDSYHEVWFDLHDDLLRTLGEGRHG